MIYILQFRWIYSEHMYKSLRRRTRKHKPLDVMLSLSLSQLCPFVFLIIYTMTKLRAASSLQIIHGKEGLIYNEALAWGVALLTLCICGSSFSRISWSIWSSLFTIDARFSCGSCSWRFIRRCANACTFWTSTSESVAMHACLNVVRNMNHFDDTIYWLALWQHLSRINPNSFKLVSARKQNWQIICTW